MNLDDLRRNWQQPAPAETRAALDAAALERLLTRRSRSPVTQMRRSVWLEIGLAAVFLLGAGAGLAAGATGHFRAMLVWLIIICLLSGFYYRRKLAVINHLAEASGAVREHVARQLESLRGLVQLYYRATLWSVPVSLGIGVFYIVGEIALEMSGRKMWLLLGVVGGAYALLGGLTFFVIRWFTRWYLQYLYGRHLDRLETALRELTPDE